MKWKNREQRNDKEMTRVAQNKSEVRVSVRWTLVLYDALVYFLVCLAFLVIYPSSIDHLFAAEILVVTVEGFVCIFGCRFLFNVYRQIWRYGGMQAYVRLLLADVIGGTVFVLLRYLPFMPKMTFPRAVTLVSINLLGILSLRIIYQYLYQSTYTSVATRTLRWLLRTVAGINIEVNAIQVPTNRIRIAIVGAGNVGVMLAEELLRNPKASYEPVCFIDTDANKIGRMIYGIRVLPEKEINHEKMAELSIQEVVFALPQASVERKKELYEQYKRMGCQVKAYDYPTMEAVKNGRRQMREFQIEELLFRPAVNFNDSETSAYYKDKTILITGGGGSIGSELCRQIVKMEPKRLVILDVYENGAYDVQQELRIAYGEQLDLAVEIASICDCEEIEKIFARHKPEIVLHAAAHKHVPLMEHNVCEAIKNNVFGTQNVLDICKKYGVKRFIMISSDKAVNPTNVMGATKRMCEMLVLSRREINPNCVYSCTRFGNVLGSAGSVVPLFRRQIQNGGPVTITDKRIIRYFMTIPEASQLVLQSGAMAKNGELFVLDMGKPVKILELAENMIQLMGYEPYKDIEIRETGLRPGEKLYEELLIKGESLSKTKNELIFVESERCFENAEIAAKLAMLRQAVESGNEKTAQMALKEAVPTFCSPEEINLNALQTEEMQMAAS